MAGSSLARWLRRGAPLWVLAGFAVLVLALGQSVALAKSAHPGPASYYVVKSAKSKCKAHYTKQTVTVRVRRHRRWVHVHQVRCVYTGNGTKAQSGGSGGVPSFPANLPTAGVTVTAIPTAVADQYRTSANQELSVDAATGVLANDSGLSLSAQLVSGAAHGTVTFDHSGAFDYTPVSGYSGIDHFSYRASDASGETSGAAQVTINVAPVAGAPGSYDVGAGATLDVGAPGLLAGAIGSGLQAELVTDAEHGSVTVNSDGSFSYTPSGGFAGADGFEFRVADADGQTSAPVAVTIEVGAAPPAPVAETFTGAVGNTELQVGGVRGSGAEVYDGSASALAGDSDPSGGTLSTTPASITTAQGGSVTLAANGTFTYQPPVGFDGPSDSFTYQVDSSEGQSAQASATIDFSGARVWYVDAAAAPGGNGSSWAPFDSLAAVSYPGGAAGAGDVVFLFPGSYGGGIALAANETLLGAPAGLTVGSENLLGASGSNPVITNASAGSAGVSVADGDNLNAVTVSGTAGAGISATDADSFAISSSVTVSGAGADGIDISGGGGDAQIAATIGGSAGHSVYVQGRSSGTLTFAGPITDTGDGLLLSGNGGATIDFTGLIDATTTNSPAFEAVNGGTIDTTSAQNTLTSVAAPALDVTSIDSGTLAFASVSSGSTPGVGPADGVLLSNTGSGAVAISGGTIQGVSGAAVSAANTANLSLSGMTLEPAAGADGVSATAVASLSLSGLTITGGDVGVVVDGDTSNADVASNTLSGQSSDGIDILPSGSGTTLTAVLTGNTIDNIDQGYGIDAQAPGGTQLDLELTGNVVQMDSASSGNGVEVASSGTVCLDPTDNTVVAAGTAPPANAMEIDESAGTFEILNFSGGSDAEAEAFLTTNNPLSVGIGAGSAAVATGAFTGPTGVCSGSIDID